jgi:hypothetical protein
MTIDLSHGAVDLKSDKSIYTIELWWWPQNVHDSSLKQCKDLNNISSGENDQVSDNGEIIIGLPIV